MVATQCIQACGKDDIPRFKAKCSLKVTWLDAVVWVFQQRLPWIFRTSQISRGVTVNGPMNGPLLSGGQLTWWSQGSEVRRATVTQITTCSSQGMKNSISELWPWHWFHPRCHPELLLHCESLKIPYFDLWYEVSNDWNVTQGAGLNTCLPRW